MGGLPLSDAKWNELVADFPGLDGQRDQCAMLGIANTRYNCIAWSVGETFEWIDTPPTVAKTVKLWKLFRRELTYLDKKFGYLRTYDQSISDVDVYLNVFHQLVEHASRRDWTTWSSKLGPDIALRHPRFALEGRRYGQASIFFTKTRPPRSFALPVGRNRTEVELQATAIAKAKIKGLVERSTLVFPTLAGTFNQKWDDWEQTWYHQNFSFYQSSTQLAQGDMWNELVGMGTAILPQVVEKLFSSSNIFGCNLYNKLQTDSTKKVDPSNVQQYYVLNKQAELITQLYYSQVTDFESLVTDWTAIQDANPLSSNYSIYLSGPAYNSILDIGKPAVPLIMEMYAQDQGGWWHELLSEIEYGNRSSLMYFDKAALYMQWSNWFQAIA